MVGRLVLKMGDFKVVMCDFKVVIPEPLLMSSLNSSILKYVSSRNKFFATLTLILLVPPISVFRYSLADCFHSARTKLRSTSFCHQPPIRESANVTRTSITWAPLGLIKFSNGRWTHLSFRHVIQSTEKHISRDCNHFQSRVLRKRC